DLSPEIPAVFGGPKRHCRTLAGFSRWRNSGWSGRLRNENGSNIFRIRTGNQKVQPTGSRSAQMEQRIAGHNVGSVAHAGPTTAGTLRPKANRAEPPASADSEITQDFVSSSSRISVVITIVTGGSVGNVIVILPMSGFSLQPGPFFLSSASSSSASSRLQ
ncbi:MAG: hypothetical protein JWM91_5412, partial [Rhodospirillales bacterium]|nr:hypothetical protein [Rhodospirillales bacterium]